jgi:hypothetical protein
MSTLSGLITPTNVLTADSTATLTNKTIGFSTNTFSGALPIANGGTGGSATPTAGGVVYGTGTVQAVTAAGTSGGVLYSAGASAPAFSAAGTSGQVLQSNGASAPTWATPAGGSLILISTVTATAAVSATITGFSSTYDNFQIQIVDLITDSNGNSNNLLGTLFLNSVEITTGYQSAVHTTATTSTAYAGAIGGSTELRFSGDSLGTTSRFNTIINLFNVNIGQKSFTSTGIGMYGGGNLANAWGFLQTPTTALTGVKFFLSSGGALLTGTFRLYGIKKT